MWKYILIYLFVMNLIAFAVMGIDKSRARQHRYRVPEKVLFALSFLGGSIGSILGMYHFHHKTRHWYFVVGMPLILFFHLILTYLYIRYIGV